MTVRARLDSNAHTTGGSPTDRSGSLKVFLLREGCESFLEVEPADDGS